MKDHNKMGISFQLFEEIRNSILKNPKINKAVIFGSRARGDYKKTSDIDICIYGNNIQNIDVNLLEDSLKEINTPLDFDIVYYDKITKEALRINIEKDGILIYAKK
ncbi:nucleotidyltransferase domain-containing protein [Clostridium sp. FAM 1755]|uniref:nucleotidyltransferase domain-containing protein n=1 Tax=Clostridium TaxID=1485 RepID=UPI0013D45EDA|nr:nucleotidyltransferase domain-containing protein [Clostridium sporogenes]NFS25136.1 nucleotidyltransferase domain-containing protein [Clostridium sporogenes]